MMLLKNCFLRIIKDFQQKKLMPLKLIFFVQSSTLFILYPYLTIHMRELGINVEETAIMSAIIPVVGIIMPPVSGMIADRIGNFKILLSLFSALGGTAALLLLLVPVGRVNIQFPDNVILGVSCDSSGNSVYTMSQSHPCDTIPSPNINATLQSCGYACPVNLLNETEFKSILTSQNYKFNVYNPKTSKNVTYNYTIAESDMPEIFKRQMDAREARKLKNLEFYNSAIRRFTKNVLFFPVRNAQLSELDCNVVNTKNNENLMVCGYESLLLKVKQRVISFKAALTAMKMSDADVAENRLRYLEHNVKWPDLGNKSTRCATREHDSELVSVEVELRNETTEEPYDVFRTEGCSRTCILTTLRKDICTNNKMQVEYNVKLTFWSYLVVRVFIGMIGGTAFAMFEGAVIAILREHKADYGLQRIYGSIGGMISSPLSGMLIDYASNLQGYPDFRPAFYLYAALKIFSSVLMLWIDLEFKAPASNVFSDVVSVLKNVEIAALLAACFVLGTAWGYIESFLFWLLEDLGASRSLMGITITVGGIAGIPLLVLSGPIINKIGHANVIFIGFIFYAIRLLGYSLIYNPWLCLIFEALESVTSSLSFTAAVTYAAKLSTTTTDSSIQGLLGGLYYGVGKGSGSLIGGYLMKAFGTRPTYQIFAVMSLVTGLIYLLFNITYLMKQPQVEGNDIVKKTPKTKTQPSIAISATQNLEESKARKEKIALETQQEPYIVDDIEAINNAKNLDIIESAQTDNSIEADHKKDLEKSNKDNKSGVRQRHTQQNGLVNPAFEADFHQGCTITVEEEPKCKK
ncbi:PREDICTED: uncharacterized protein LOC105367748 [Ceratosolen solmsi marchali]|uniref:Uncharacterized protein LOC105367748 n=1 Tax=Ceratosolen solmsi marchali TaxID=326594 RepID=A0AAJ7E1X4_9HYME|nr:PREDICTED: uncharacterized protein LOC105367748 [Ceratosolen solmsi marchali]